MASVVRLTIPAAPSGSYRAGATIQVRASFTSGSSAWVYLVSSTGAIVAGGTNPVQVNSGTSMNTTFSIPTPSAGAVYYVAVAPTNNAATSIVMNMTASLPYG
jgi:hypothetical protein